MAHGAGGGLVGGGFGRRPGGRGSRGSAPRRPPGALGSFASRRRRVRARAIAARPCAPARQRDSA
eukprot:1913506-Prymnesium_polylepis.1